MSRHAGGEMDGQKDKRWVWMVGSTISQCFLSYDGHIEIIIHPKANTEFCHNADKPPGPAISRDSDLYISNIIPKYMSEMEVISEVATFEENCKQQYTKDNASHVQYFFIPGVMMNHNQRKSIYIMHLMILSEEENACFMGNFMQNKLSMSSLWVNWYEPLFHLCKSIATTVTWGLLPDNRIVNNIFLWTHLPLDKMVIILQTIFSDAFLWNKVLYFD